MTYAAKAKTQQFTRRKLILLKKADELARLCNADLALIIRKNGRYYIRNFKLSNKSNEQIDN